MSILKLQARGESQPTPEGPRLSMHCKTSLRVVCGESGTNYQYQSPDRPLIGSCSWRPYTFARAKKRSWPNANNEVSHASVSSLVTFVRSRHATEGERACCVTRPNNGFEGDDSEYCTNAVYFCLQLFRQQGQYTAKDLCLSLFGMDWKGFFLLSIKLYFRWNPLKCNYFFLVQKCKRQLLSGPS